MGKVATNLMLATSHYPEQKKSKSISCNNFKSSLSPKKIACSSVVGFDIILLANINHRGKATEIDLFKHDIQVIREAIQTLTCLPARFLTTHRV